MKKILYGAAAALLLNTANLQAQHSFTDGVSTLEYSGLLSAIYKDRFLDASNPSNHVGNVLTNPLNQKKNTFGLNTARLNIQGTRTNHWAFRLQVDLAQIGMSAVTGEYPAIVDAWVAYMPIPSLHFILGYQKVPYSANSLTSMECEPYWQRAEITRGNVFSRRDVGLTLKKSFLGERINVFGGAYSGMGEYILSPTTGGDNDPNGQPEWVGRVEASNHKHNNNDIYDIHNAQRPVVQVGFNARYVERTKSYPGLVDYDLKLVNGTKKTMGADAAFAYRGLSAQFEIHRITITPKGADTSRLYGKNTNHFNAGGWLAEVNYFNRMLHSGVYVRYDNFIPNDLVADNKEQTLSFGYNFFLQGTKSMLKVQYLDRLDKQNKKLLRTSDELRIGWQVLF